MANDTGFATENVTQNSNISNGFYSGVMHADGHADGNAGGKSDSSSSYGSAPSFQSTFTVSFTVDALTHAALLRHGGLDQQRRGLERPGAGAAGRYLERRAAGDDDPGPAELERGDDGASTCSSTLCRGTATSFIATTSASTNRTLASGPGERVGGHQLHGGDSRAGWRGSSGWVGWLDASGGAEQGPEQVLLR